MTHPSKTKGNSYERELVNSAKEHGLKAKRAYASNGESLGHAADVDLVVEGQRIQAKRRKNLPAYLQPSDTTDAVVFRQDRGESLVLLSWVQYLGLIGSSNGGGMSATMQEIESPMTTRKTTK
ncbi:MAG: hypothetical protein AAGD07_24195 [Planctomycetota bacterium]